MEGLTNMKRYPKKQERLMKLFYDSLSEKDKRHYAAIESIKAGWGGQQYIAEILDCDPRTIARGIKELENNSLGPDDKIRAEGGGRKKVINTTENIDEVFLEVLRNHTAGDPMDEKVKWTNLTQIEISELMKEQGINASDHVVRQLLKKHGYVKRQAVKKKQRNQ